MFSQSSLNLFGTWYYAAIPFSVPCLYACQFKPAPCFPKYQVHPSRALKPRFQLLFLDHRWGSCNLLPKFSNLRRMKDVEKVTKDSFKCLEGMGLDLSTLNKNKVLGSNRIVNELPCEIQVIKPKRTWYRRQNQLLFLVPSGFLYNDSFRTLLAASLMQEL